ncbi:MAG TPA: aspartate-semialdehyde dehydrogenase [Candidatus Paceibacterota bacterium]|nr:aspartate-semialdehyde dehydrogenase [Verrucomicrobiota bacterium]HRY50483.1 aspartate-semialdehyde dehydrogenase [Candidatus Paceibacterota bacterium]HSA02493.1 aspartate-semialdehyde dehydrogenase [Candidatus Paceibacterota bacterium]
MQKKKVAIIGATGLAGQQFLASLARHPGFEVAALAASARSAGKCYREAITHESGSLQWFCPEPLSPALADLPVQEARTFDARTVDLVFAAVESDAARELEPIYARTTPVVSTASAFRDEPDVPIFIPGVNLEHDGLIAVQKARRGWQGFITPIPNCTVTGLAITLKPLQDAFGIQSVLMTSLQACSGAGRSPGVIGLDIIDNVIPYIPKEEEKVQREAQKILGRLEGDHIVPANWAVSATCTRVPVLEGHTEAVNVSLERSASLADVKSVLAEFGRNFISRRLPSSPSRLIQVTDEPFRPQPRRDRDTEDGMVTTVGRLRVDPVLSNGIKYVLVSHNTKMGAAKGAILVAEHLVDRGLI